MPERFTRIGGRPARSSAEHACPFARGDVGGCRSKIKKSRPMKKITISRLSGTKAGSRNQVESWHGGGDTEIRQYARSLQNAARTLVAKQERDQNPSGDRDACSVVLLYRQALEINLKMLVGEGSNFLPSPTDPISLFKTNSLRWLAQIVCQIIRAVTWESEFTCDGISSLAEFSAVVNE